MVTVDIDGTLTVGHGWRFLADRLHRSAEYATTDAAFFAGEESEDIHLRRLLTIAEGVPVARIEEVLSATPVLRGIRETVADLRSSGVVVALLSHNPGYVSGWYARTYGFQDWDGIAGGDHPEVVDGTVAPAGPVRTDKLGGLRRLLARHPAPAREVAHVGDANADAAVFPHVGFGIALNSSSPEVERRADVALHTSDLRAILLKLAAAHPRPHPEG